MEGEKHKQQRQKWQRCCKKRAGEVLGESNHFQRVMLVSKMTLLLLLTMMMLLRHRLFQMLQLASSSAVAPPNRRRQQAQQLPWGTGKRMQWGGEERMT
jgi:hypothetical protein